MTIEDRRYEPSLSRDLTFGGVGYPTRCEPNYFGTGQFWVVGTEATESNQVVERGYFLEVELFATAADAEAAGRSLTFELSHQDENLDLALVIPSELPPGETEVGSWTIDGNRAFGEVLLRQRGFGEIVTATFEFVCGSG